MAVAEMTPVTRSRIDISRPSSTELLSYIPRSELRREVLDPLKLYVATHELQHTLVGRDYGLVVTAISTIPNGDIGGYTSFAPTDDIASFQTAAAASKVAGPHGDPFGFGHDEYQIKSLSRFPGSLTPEQAFYRAAATLAGYPLKVREKAAEMVAYLGYVSGHMIDQILERARLEVQEEESTEVFLPEKPFIQPGIKKNVQREFTIVLRRLPNGEVVEEIIEIKICSVCGERNGHSIDCPEEQEDITNIEM